MAPILEVKNLKKYFSTPRGLLHAVDGVNLKIEAGKTLGVVGESGCGKTTLGRTVIHLQSSTDGQILFEGEDITHVGRKKLSNLRSQMQIIFQDPFSSLDPRMCVGDLLAEPLKFSHKYNKVEVEQKTLELMETVGLAERLRYSYPHELDGGRRQRIGIGRALALDPKFIVCDEPVSALDVSIQAQVLNLLLDLQQEKGLTYLFITHDLSVVRYISDEICVMYMGQVVERAEADELFSNPLHPYTQALLASIPEPVIREKKQRQILSGEVSSPINPAPGCRFASRCPYASEACSQPQQLKETSPNHFVMCERAVQNG